ncbi:MAG: hypothetical protein K8S99_16765 [Planctomycetes bacterium]|nr:hypothetical protein [Planctomycetota bacterium]
MATSFGALCSDFYVNQKLALKMDLPADRETILHLLDQIRKSEPTMDRFRRYEGEYALESARRDAEYRWLALRQTSIRSGHVNPTSMTEAYRLHKLVYELAPYHLTISPLDVDYIELLFGFDLECKANHDAIVYDALFAHSPVGNLLRDHEQQILDVQPIFGMNLSRKGDLQAYFEVKTRTKSRRGKASRTRREPISVFLTLRRYGPIHDIGELVEIFDTLTHHAETLATERLIPNLLTPISRHITSST